MAHAQSASAADTSTLQAQLQLMKDKLQLLQLQQAQTAMPAAMQVEVVAQPVVAQPVATISVSDASALNSALTALATTLVNLQSAIQSDPQFMTQNGPIVARSLAGIENSLAAVLVSMQSPAASAPVIAVAPQTTKNSGTGSGSSAPLVMANGQTLTPAAPAQSAQDSLLPSVDSLTQPATQDNSAAAVAASALSGKNRLPAIIVGIILLAMIAILVWGRGGEQLETAPVASRSSAPKVAPAPATPVPPSISFISNQAPVSTASTPLSSSMAQGQGKNAI